MPLRLGKLTEQGVIDRPYRIYRGGIWDIPSDAPASTEFATTRFLAPLLAQRGFAAFMDCDTVTVGDVYELWRLADPRYAVQVVKHEHAGTEGVKMDGQPQTQYPRKNWSSVVLWNVDHPGNRRLTRAMICNLPGRELHAFCWLRDEEIGELPAGWNWLVSVQAMPDALRLAHFTLGGPWLPGWHGGPYDDLWSSYQADFRAAMRAGDARGGPGTG